MSRSNQSLNPMWTSSTWIIERSAYQRCCSSRRRDPTRPTNAMPPLRLSLGGGKAPSCPVQSLRTRRRKTSKDSRISPSMSIRLSSSSSSPPTKRWPSIWWECSILGSWAPFPMTLPSQRTSRTSRGGSTMHSMSSFQQVCSAKMENMSSVTKMPSASKSNFRAKDSRRRIHKPCLFRSWSKRTSLMRKNWRSKNCEARNKF